jgi:hypothetical protein
MIWCVIGGGGQCYLGSFVSLIGVIHVMIGVYLLGSVVDLFFFLYCRMFAGIFFLSFDLDYPFPFPLWGSLTQSILYIFCGYVEIS